MSGHEGDERIRPAQRAVDPGLVRVRYRGEDRGIIRSEEDVADDGPPGKPLNPRYSSTRRLCGKVNPDSRRTATIDPGAMR